MQIEGKNAVYEAIKNGQTINKLLIQNGMFDGMSKKIIATAKDSNIKFDFVDKKVMDKLSLTGKHQGFILKTTEFNYCTLEDILNKAESLNEDAFVVFLDEIEDPHNLGAIIRSCECAGVHGIVIPEHRACPVTETVIRASAGAISNMLIARVNNLKNAFKYFKDNGMWIYSAETGGENIFSSNLKGKIGIVIGSEGFGTKPSIKDECDGIISIPLRGSINSLNASVATGIVIFEVLRQRSL